MVNFHTICDSSYVIFIKLQNRDSLAMLGGTLPFIELLSQLNVLNGSLLHRNSLQSDRVIIRYNC